MGASESIEEIMKKEIRCRGILEKMSWASGASIKLIGKGAFGMCYRLEKENDPQAVKFIFTKSEEELNGAMDEARLILKCDHKNVAKVNFFFPYEDVILINMKCYNGSLRNILKKEEKIPKGLIIKIMIDSLSGLAYIHSQGLIHRDIKPDNIFFDDDLTFVIGDFGLCRKLPEDVLATSMVGTPAYLAPEVFGGQPYDNTVDIYAMGCILFELKYGMLLRQAIQERKIAEIMQEKNDINDLIMRMINPDPKKRPPAKICLFHPYFIKFIKKVTQNHSEKKEKKSSSSQSSSNKSSFDDKPSAIINISSYNPKKELINNSVLASEMSYKGNKTIVSTRVPSNTRIIASEMFSGCIKLECVFLDEGITEICDHAFEFCTSLEQIKLPRSLKKIGENAFFGCENLKTIVVQSKIRNITSNPFVYCKRLKNIEITENSNLVFKNKLLIDKDSNALIACLENRNKEIEVPRNIEKIIRNSFIGCTEVEAVKVNKNTIIDNEAFDDNISIMRYD